MKRFLIVLVCSLYWIAPAQAQVCGGGASFSKGGPLQAGASIALASDVKMYSVGGGVGIDPWWGQAGLQFTSTTGVDGHASGFYVTLGGDFAADDDKKLYVCPILSFTHAGLPSIPGVDSSSSQYGFGGNAGYVAAKMDSANVIPTVGLLFHHQSFSTSAGTFNASTSETYATLQLGLGFVFNDKLALIPSVFIPIGLTGGENSFVIAASYNLGK